MKLTLSLESGEVIDVPDEAVIEETNPGEEVVEGFKKLDSFFEIIANLKHVQDNIKRFGVTKELLHLVNTDNQLGKVLDISLPYYESDEEEINEEELPDGKELIAATEGVISKAKDGIVAAFKWLKEKIVAFFKWFWDLITFKKKKVEEVKQSLNLNSVSKKVEETINKNDAKMSSTIKNVKDTVKNITENDFNSLMENTKIKFYSKEVSDDKLRHFESILNRITHSKIDSKTGTIRFHDHGLEEMGAILGWNHIYVHYKDDIIEKQPMTDKKHLDLKEKNNTLSEEALTLKELGYSSFQEFTDQYDTLIARLHFFEKAKNILTDLTKVCDEQIKSHDNVDSEVTKRIKINTQMLLSIHKDTVESLTKYTNQLINSGYKLRDSVVNQLTHSLSNIKES